MLNKFINWIKEHKLESFLIIVVAFLVWPQIRYSLPSFLSYDNYSKYEVVGDKGSYPSSITDSAPGYMDRDSEPMNPDYPPQPAENRMVSYNSNLSLLVKDVNTTTDQIIKSTKGFDGYMVNTSKSLDVDSPTATIIVRVPTDKLDLATQAFKDLAVKVTSEQISGRDITDQYTDIAEHLNLLNKTKARYEEIRDKAKTVSELLNVQRELSNLQRQIDSLKGQQKYLEQVSKYSKITIYIAEDEIALPYTPSEMFRPKVIFTLAVRSLVKDFYKIGQILIWIGVYSVFWVPALVIALIIKKRISKGTSQNL